MDLDEFLAAVEKRRRPGLVGRPVVVGGSGDPTHRREVVASASYEARAFGVRAGMPLRAAFRKCPEAVFLPSDHPAYESASEEVMVALRSLPVRVEVWGWDEAFVAAHVDDPEELAARIRGVVRRETGLSCSVGVGDNKLRAKMATGFGKPAGVYRLTQDNWMAVMADHPTDDLWGIGRKTAQKLAEHGIHTVAELAEADPKRLAAIFGPTIGPGLCMVGRGLGGTEVTTTPREARSRSRARTFPEDLTDRAQIEEKVAELARDIGGEVIATGRAIMRVGVTVRTAAFFTRTKAAKLAAPTTDVAEIEAAALMVLERFELDRPVRLLGVRVALVPDTT